MTTKSLKLNQFELGVCYYPEQWPEDLWVDDFRRMRDLGFSIIRLAEFAWTIFEPVEGTFSFDFFDRVIDLAHHNNLKVILGTPTATPPAWLTTKYPEVLNVTQNGLRYALGQRRHYNYNTQVYRDLAARIVRKMAEHYKSHPAVIGWQIDNELNCETNVFYSPADNLAFRSWLKEKYSTLEALNKAWGTVFWNQTYTDWNQVNLTGPTPTNSQNPHQYLDEKRFFSDSVIGFAGLQAEILREIAPSQWITTNGIFGHLDSHKLAEETLDFISYDSYPNFSTWVSEPNPLSLFDRKWSWNLSVTRSISPNFCLMEQQSGSGGWVNQLAQSAPKPGQMRLWTYQSIGHGADMLLYYRWRTATFGNEIYWHGLLNYDNRPNRRLKEAAQIGQELKILGPLVVGSQYSARVAIVNDYDNQWDGEFDIWHGPYNQKSVYSWFKALQYRHIPVDALYLRTNTTLEEMSKYDVLIYPHPTILTESSSALLAEYTRQGGTIVFGCRTGYKDLDGHCYMTPMPGPVAELCGVTVEDFTRIEPSQVTPLVRWCHTKEDRPNLEADDFNDIMQVMEGTNAKVLAEYTGCFYKGSPALVLNNYGMGRTYYFGAVFNEMSATALIEELNLTSPASDWLKLPGSIELCIRKSPETGENFLFLLNFSEWDQTINLNKAVKNVLTGEVIQGNVKLSAFDVLVLKE